MKPAVFLTGATGFLGMEVLARLLEEGDREVLALVRAPTTTRRAEARLDGVLAKLWRRPRALPRARPRRARRRSPQPGLGLGERARRGRRAHAGAVLHCAASISFDLPLDEARAINVDGTRAGDRLRARGAGARPAGPLRPRLDRLRRAAATRARSASASSTPASRSATPTSRPRRGRAHRRRRPRDLGAGDRAPEHRDGRVATRAGRPRSTSSTGRCGRSRAGCSRRSPALPDGARRRRPGRLRRRRARAPARPPRGRASFNLVAGRDACDRRRARPSSRREHFGKPAPAVRAPGASAPALARRRPRRRVLPLLRHGGRVRRRPRPRGAGARRASRRRRCATTSRG